MPSFLLFTQIVVYCAFTFMIAYFVERLRRFDLFVVFLGMAFVFSGEMVNLFISRMAVYNGCSGIPIYIIMAGSMLVWLLYAVTFAISLKIQRKGIIWRIVVLMALSIFLPLIELFGLKSGFWYWRRPYPVFSVAWFSGVWKYYFIFLGIPAILAHLIRASPQKKERQACKR